MHLISFIVILSSFLIVYCEKARFDNYHVYTIQIDNEEQLEALQGLESNQDGLVFIEAPLTIGSDAEILVPPHKLADITDLFERYDMKAEVKIKNFQRFLTFFLFISKKIYRDFSHF